MSNGTWITIIVFVVGFIFFFYRDGKKINKEREEQIYLIYLEAEKNPCTFFYDLDLARDLFNSVSEDNPLSIQAYKMFMFDELMRKLDLNSFDVKTLHEDTKKMIYGVIDKVFILLIKSKREYEAKNSNTSVL